MAITARILSALSLAATLAGLAQAAGAEIAVVTSIKPVHSLVSGVMQGAGTPHLIVTGDASPHTYALKPSDAAALQKARIVFWIGPQLESFLEKSLHTLAPAAQQVALADSRGLVKLPLRDGGVFEMQEGHEEQEHDHGESAFNPHIWLDPLNAAAMVDEIEQVFVSADPDNASAYKANADGLRKRLGTLREDIAARLAPVADRRFIVFHDALHYFENRFGLTAAGSITVNPDAMPGARRVTDIQTRIRELGPVCVFAEPQFNPRLIETAIDGTDARSAILDPVGADLADGPELYFTLLRNLAGSIRDCLSATG